MSTFSTFFRKCLLSNMSKLKSWNVAGNSFRMSKNPDMGKIHNPTKHHVYMVGVARSPVMLNSMFFKNSWPCVGLDRLGQPVWALAIQSELTFSWRHWVPQGMEWILQQKINFPERAPPPQTPQGNWFSVAEFIPSPAWTALMPAPANQPGLELETNSP